MRAVIQAVSSASVRVNGGEPRAIGPGLMILLGVRDTDSLLRRVKARGDDRHAYRVTHRIVDGRTPDDVCLRIRSLLDGLRCLGDLEHAEVLLCTRHVEQDAACTVDARLEQRRSDGSLGGLYSGILARSLANAHQSRPRIAHDALDISKVEVDEARQGDEGQRQRAEVQRGAFAPAPGLGGLRAGACGMREGVVLHVVGALVDGG